MKKYFFIFVLLFLIIKIYGEELDYQEIDDSLYGIKNFSIEDENIILETQKEFYKLAYEIKNNPKKVNKVEKYLNLINYDSLLGTTMKDSILLYVHPSANEDFINILENYLKNNNNEAVADILLIRKNMQNYTSSNFNFSTTLVRKNLKFDISIMLPNTNWEEIKYDKYPDNITLIAGEDNNTGTIIFKKERIPKKNYDIIKDHFYSKHKTTLFKKFPRSGMSKVNKNDMYTVKPGKIKLIAENIKIGNKIFDKVYEQITTNSDKYNFQVYVLRTRFYILKNDLYSISVQTIIAGQHVLANKIYLIKQHGYLLDTVNF